MSGQASSPNNSFSNVAAGESMRESSSRSINSNNNDGASAAGAPSRSHHPHHLMAGVQSFNNNNSSNSNNGESSASAGISSSGSSRSTERISRSQQQQGFKPTVDKSGFEWLPLGQKLGRRVSLKDDVAHPGSTFFGLFLAPKKCFRLFGIDWRQRFAISSSTSGRMQTNLLAKSHGLDVFMLGFFHTLVSIYHAAVLLLSWKSALQKVPCTMWQL